MKKSANRVLVALLATQVLWAQNAPPIPEPDPRYKVDILVIVGHPDDGDLRRLGFVRQQHVAAAGSGREAEREREQGRPAPPDRVHGEFLCRGTPEGTESELPSQASLDERADCMPARRPAAAMYLVMSQQFR